MWLAVGMAGLTGAGTGAEAVRSGDSAGRGSDATDPCCLSGEVSPGRRGGDVGGVGACAPGIRVPRMAVKSTEAGRVAGLGSAGWLLGTGRDEGGSALRTVSGFAVGGLSGGDGGAAPRDGDRSGLAGTPTVGVDIGVAYTDDGWRGRGGMGTGAASPKWCALPARGRAASLLGRASTGTPAPGGRRASCVWLVLASLLGNAGLDLRVSASALGGPNAAAGLYRLSGALLAGPNAAAGLYLTDPDLEGSALRGPNAAARLYRVVEEP